MIILIQTRTNSILVMLAIDLWYVKGNTISITLYKRTLCWEEASQLAEKPENWIGKIDLACFTS